MFILFLVGIYTNNAASILINFYLVAVSRIRNLTLEKALFNGSEGYAAPDAASEFDRRLG